jgi:glycosyltransferase involved in cell wall biosynthesis
MPIVSVIMSVYNGEKYLAAAIESIRAQTFSHFEFIIIDDGSADGSPQILKRFAEKDSRLRVETRANKGLTRSLNEAIAQSRGEFLARMDADDVALPNRLQIQIDFLRAHPDVVLLGGGYELIDGAGRVLTRMIPPTDDATLQEHALSGRTPICHPLAMMRRDAVAKVGGYDESLAVAQDLDLWLKLGEVGKVACVPDVLLRYRQHPKSVSEERQAMQIENMRLACQRACARRGIAREFKGDVGWRPTSDRASRHRFALQYGWWAFNSGQRRTAMVYGTKALGAQPFSAESWRLLICSAIKPMPISSPSRGTPGEGRGEGSVSNSSHFDAAKNPRPNPLPQYRERG